MVFGAVRGLPVTDIVAATGVNHNLVAKVCDVVRTAMSKDQLRHQRKLETEGLYGHLEVDETSIRKQRVKDGTGTHAYRLMWYRVLGIIKRGTHAFIGYPMPAKSTPPGAPPPSISRDEWEPYLRIIKPHPNKKKNTRLHSDGARAYNMPLPQGVVHTVVNHSRSQWTKFGKQVVTTTSGKERKVKSVAGTQSIEAVWPFLKRGIPRGTRTKAASLEVAWRSGIWRWLHTGEDMWWRFVTIPARHGQLSWSEFLADSRTGLGTEADEGTTKSDDSALTDESDEWGVPL